MIQASKIPDLPLILALDVEAPEDIFPLLDELQGELHYVKIGPRLYFQGGQDLIRRLVGQGYKVFLDLKLHDIPNTVGMAVEALSDLGIWALTLHTSGGIPMMARAREAARQNSEMLLLGVTVLTSLAGEDWDRVHPALALEKALRGRAEAAGEAGIDGVVCSPLDLPLIRSACDLLTVVPGIRPASMGDDQARIATPSRAIASGADYLVVGRPILKAIDRRQATLDIKRSMKEGFQCR